MGSQKLFPYIRDPVEMGLNFFACMYTEIDFIKDPQKKTMSCLLIPNNCVFVGVSVETSKPRRSRSQHDIEASPSLLQVYSVYRNVRHVQTIRKPRLFGSQRRR